MIPFIDLNRETYSLETVAELLAQKRFIGGEPVRQLDEQLEQTLNCKYCVTCANGTDALQIALRAYEVGAGDTVLIPEYTFWATAEAVANVGATPVTIDIDPNDKCMDYTQFCEALGYFKPKAVILVHILGWCSKELKRYRSACRERGIVLIEDGAQSFGTLFDGESIFADAECITTSFYPAKVLGGCGDGGAVFTNSEKHSNIIRRLTNHGRSEHYNHSHLGWNSRLDAMNAEYLFQRVKSIGLEIERRRRLTQRYQKEFGHGSEFECVLPPKIVSENGYLFTIKFRSKHDRDKVKEMCDAKGIGTAITYPIPISHQPAYISSGYKSFSDASIALDFGTTLLNLPLFPGLTNEEQDYVIDTIKNIYK